MPSYKGVKLRLSHIDNSTSKNDLLSFKEIVLNKIDKYVYGFDNDTLEEIVSKILIKKHLSISIAESCTGGYLSKLLTDIRWDITVVDDLSNPESSSPTNRPFSSKVVFKQLE